MDNASLMSLMHHFTRIAIAVASLAVLQVGAEEINSAEDLKTVRQKGSYALGVRTALNWAEQGANIDWDAFLRGVQDAESKSGEYLLADDARDQAIRDFRTEVETRRKEENKAASEKFMAENKEKEGVETTESGLQYKVITMGTGPKPKPTDRVTFHYTGTLINGKKFDSSYDKGRPITYAVKDLIPGWIEGLQLMPVGSKFQFFVPWELGYKERAPANIGPYQALLFDVELLAIEQPAQAAKPAPAQQPVTSDIIKVPSAEELAKGAKIEIIKPEDVQKEIEKERARQNGQPEQKPEEKQD